MKTAPLTVPDLKNAILSSYIKTGSDVTVADLAGLVGKSESTVRKVINDAHGIPGCCMSQEGRTSYSKSFRGMESGAHMVWVYGPSRETLRKLIRGEEV